MTYNYKTTNGIVTSIMIDTFNLCIMCATIQDTTTCDLMYDIVW